MVDHAAQLPASAADAIWWDGGAWDGWPLPALNATASRDAPGHDACLNDAAANVHATAVCPADVPSS